ncbi:Sulfate/thiosulfate import ATP-binding protein CysA [Rhodobacteraceae bacterium THAF1]|uniref:ATP-binding cassette domain-containing protein n=1 Tax=Palleronia sp. THAF1 TaxID=2587842 RepID=UPI000F4144E1|nr:ATP-binding cassette domain-containing protein [Palleronia sp. THAF1]QFU10297.1 Sulfate/thiosulfate import ATP-binding protein CysA [Palleronia sp. THAF1]VDC16798.1 Sulfate/thiosulfate import ATP-binding protein CysA [Rhodobacteraceae bacterium THAF1]
MSDGLNLSNVSISLNGTALFAIDAQVAKGKVLTVMGPSGSGKSTLLAFLTGTLDRTFAAQGRIVLNGRDVTDLPTHRRRIGILFQDDLLFPHLSVAGNLAFGLPPGPKAQRQEFVEQALDEVGLADFGPRDPATLSGGQRARIALMRTILAGPEALLLDEPFSRLDADRREQTRQMVFQTATARGLPVVLVTHDGEDADAAGGQIIRLGAIT